MISLLYNYCLLNGKSFQQNTYDNKRWLTIVGKIAKNRGKAKIFTFVNKNGNVTPPLPLEFSEDLDQSQKRLQTCSRAKFI